MKRVLIATILGISASVATSYGQGYVQFINYSGTQGAGGTPIYSLVTWATGTYAGLGVGSEFNADLLYKFGTMTSWATAAGSFTPFFSTAIDGGNPLVDGAGTFLGGTATVANGWTAAAGAVQFIAEAFNGSSYASSSVRGYSNVFTMTPDSNPLDIQFPDTLNVVGGVVTGLQPFAVPEPTTLVLAGLGAAGLLMFRRK